MKYKTIKIAVVMIKVMGSNLIYDSVKLMIPELLLKFDPNERERKKNTNEKKEQNAEKKKKKLRQNYSAKKTIIEKG